MSHRTKLLAILVMAFFTMSPVVAQKADTHKIFAAWDAGEVLEFSITLGAYRADTGAYCNLVQLFDQECANYVQETGDPLIAVQDSGFYSTLEWEDNPAFTGYFYCIDQPLFAVLPDTYIARLSIVGSTNGHVDQVFTVPMNQENAPCFSNTAALDGEYLDTTGFIEQTATSISPVISPVPEDGLVFRLIQPEENLLMMMVDITQPENPTPSFAIGFPGVPSVEVPTGMIGEEVFVSRKELSTLGSSIFVTFSNPMDEAKAEGKPVPFAVAIYDAGNLVALYYGQTRSIYTPWIVNYQMASVAITDLPLYDGFIHIIGYLGQSPRLG